MPYTFGDSFVSEAECPCCSQWPPEDRKWKREELGRITLKEPICKACCVAFLSGLSGLPTFTEEDLDEYLRLKTEGKLPKIELRPRNSTEPPRKH